ncbi:histidine kinase [Xanthomonas sp. Kuri4-1]
MPKAREIMQGLLISILYCPTFLLLWFGSIDQWYLPAGLRVVSLLYRPYRQWPFLLVGDAAAMLWLRVPQGEHYDLAWVYLSPFLHAPSVACVIWIVREYGHGLLDAPKTLVPVTAVFAVANAFCSIVLNTLLGGPSTDPMPELLLRYASGSYLGILMVLMPVLLWKRVNVSPLPPSLMRDLGLGIVATLVMFVMLRFASGPLARQLGLIAMLTPTVVLTLLHGWRGAAFGTLLAGFALEFSLPRVHQIGYFDQTVFNAQLLQVATTIVLFAFSDRLRARRWISGVASGTGDREKPRARESYSRESYSAAERLLRNRVLAYSDVNVQLNRMRKHLVSELRARGQHSSAMGVIRSGVIESRMMQEYLAVLYPLEVETHGLYRALRSAALAGSYDARLDHELRGDCRRLSLDLQLAAYRCVLNGLELLQPADSYLVRGRAWRSAQMQGLVICLHVVSRRSDADAFPDKDMEEELRTRIEAHGGLLKRRHALTMSFLLSEGIPVETMRHPSGDRGWLPAGHTR